MRQRDERQHNRGGHNSTNSNTTNITNTHNNSINNSMNNNSMNNNNNSINNSINNNRASLRLRHLEALFLRSLSDDDWHTTNINNININNSHPNDESRSEEENTFDGGNLHQSHPHDSIMINTMNSETSQHIQSSSLHNMRFRTRIPLKGDDEDILESADVYNDFENYNRQIVKLNDESDCDSHSENENDIGITSGNQDSGNDKDFSASRRKSETASLPRKISVADSQLLFLEKFALLANAKKRQLSDSFYTISVSDKYDTIHPIADIHDDIYDETNPCRDFDEDQCSDENDSILYTDGTTTKIVYMSEIIEGSMNPSWKHIPRLQFHATRHFILTVYTKSSSSNSLRSSSANIQSHGKNSIKNNQQRHTIPSGIYDLDYHTQAIHRIEHEGFIQCCQFPVRLKDVIYLGDDLSMVHQPFPTNSIILKMTGGGYYLVDPERSVPSTPPLLQVNNSKIKRSYKYTSIQHLLSTQRSLWLIQSEIHAIIQQAQLLEQNYETVATNIRQQKSIEARITLIEKEIMSRTQEIQSYKHRIHELRCHYKSRHDRIIESMSERDFVRRGYDDDVSEMDNLKRNCNRYFDSVSEHQRNLIIDLNSIYPIEPSSDNSTIFTIRTLKLPNSDYSNTSTSSSTASSFASVFSSVSSSTDTIEPDKLATALGFTAHLVTLLSRILQVPLRYPINPMSSRSLILDRISRHFVGNREFPLYPKAVEKSRFEYGVFLLNKDIEQLMNHVGLTATNLRNTLPNLRHLIDTITTKKSNPPSTFPQPLDPPCSQALSTPETSVNCSKPSTTPQDQHGPSANISFQTGLVPFRLIDGVSPLHPSQEDEKRGARGNGDVVRGDMFGSDDGDGGKQADNGTELSETDFEQRGGGTQDGVDKRWGFGHFNTITSVLFGHGAGAGAGAGVGVGVGVGVGAGSVRNEDQFDVE